MNDDFFCIHRYYHKKKHLLVRRMRAYVRAAERIQAGKRRAEYYISLKTTVNSEYCTTKEIIFNGIQRNWVT